MSRPLNNGSRHLGIGLGALLACAWVPSQAADSGTSGPNTPPSRITVRCGEVTLLLRQSSQWTPGRIDFRGTPMTTEKSAYGTVFSFPGIGFIGTAHLENEPEDLRRLQFTLDGHETAQPPAEWTGRTFRFQRQSRLRGLRLDCSWELKDNRLVETTRVRTEQEIPLKLVYHFMHAWVPTMSRFAAGRDGQPPTTGELGDSAEVARKFYVEERVDWVSVYEPGSQQFAVSRLQESPAEGGHISKIWNVPGTYRKYYLTCFQNETVPAGFDGTWRMVTGFGKAPPEQWTDTATEMAGMLRRR